MRKVGNQEHLRYFKTQIDHYKPPPPHFVLHCTGSYSDKKTKKNKNKTKTKQKQKQKPVYISVSIMVVIVLYHTYYTITDFCRSEYEFSMTCKIILTEAKG